MKSELSLQIRTYISVSFPNWKKHSEGVGTKQYWWFIFHFAVQTSNWSQRNYKGRMTLWRQPLSSPFSWSSHADFLCCREIIQEHLRFLYSRNRYSHFKNPLYSSHWSNNDLFYNTTKLSWFCVFKFTMRTASAVWRRKRSKLSDRCFQCLETNPSPHYVTWSELSLQGVSCLLTRILGQSSKSSLKKKKAPKSEQHRILQTGTYREVTWMEWEQKSDSLAVYWTEAGPSPLSPAGLHCLPNTLHTSATT